MSAESTSARPLTAMAYRQFLNEERLMGSRCTDSGELFIPPRPLCPSTFRPNMEWFEFSGEAKLVTFTAVHIGTTSMIEAGYDRTHPYVTGIVELVEGPRMSAEIVGVDAADPESIPLGLALQATFVERDEGEKAHKQLVFKPSGS